jgi:hypothetical protein
MKMTSTFTSIFDQIVAGDVGLLFFGVCCAALGVGLGVASYGVSLALSQNEVERKIGRSMLLSAGFQFAVLAVALMSGLWQMAGIGLLVAAYIFWLIRKKKAGSAAGSDEA